jgi:hypothetical protein
VSSDPRPSSGEPIEPTSSGSQISESRVEILEEHDTAGEDTAHERRECAVVDPGRGEGGSVDERVLAGLGHARSGGSPSGARPSGLHPSCRLRTMLLTGRLHRLSI